MMKSIDISSYGWSMLTFANGWEIVVEIIGKRYNASKINLCFMYSRKGVHNDVCFVGLHSMV